TRDREPVTDDHPRQEYAVKSLLDFGEAVPSAIVDLDDVKTWCPKCFVGRSPAPPVEGLDTYLALLGRAYAAPAADGLKAREIAEPSGRVIAGSAYLGAIVPESADLHNFLGLKFAESNKIAEAIGEFRSALQLAPDSALTHWHLGAALASRGDRLEALAHL